MPEKRSIRIGNCSGAGGDGPDQLYRLATEGPIDAIFGDYLAEVNIAWRALEMQEDPELGYERGFLTHLNHKNAAEIIAEKNIKLVNDAGALNPYGLYKATKELLKSKGLSHVQVAWVEGDNVTAEVLKAQETGNTSRFPHLDIQGQDLIAITNRILSANAYIGCRGIVAALNAGAQIVICGRCCDASPVMGLASWWHGWTDTDFDQLAGSLIAGHLTECGPYTTGGNFCGFKSIPNLVNVGYPICEISEDGSCVITMHEGSNGAVTVDTVKAQLVYEIQGPLYLNPDAVAHLEDIQVIEDAPNRIFVTGVKGSAPPPTTKLAVCSFGGYQAEIATFIVGLDVKEKAELQRKQILDNLDRSKFSQVTIDTYGSVPEDPLSQKDATVYLRHFVQAPTKEAIQVFTEIFLFYGMQGYGGFHPHMDFRTLAPKPYVRYFPYRYEQSELKLRVHSDNKNPIAVSPVQITAPFGGQKSYEAANPAPLASFGPTKKAPLGSIVLARSGDKGGNANVGLWVRHDDEWPWLQSFLSTGSFKELLGNDYRPDYRVERFELPHLHAVHFVTYGILEEGVSSSSIIDGFAKSFGEFLRARKVDIPEQFLGRPWV
ncbi:hypothetical protein CBS115989_8774 [Aspergillus niger]|uniref:DUF1446-domain-containing protein n=1 Tax=Aspergillus niger ATCC 13496 TaxID=1353008 RepID=A0A370BGM1_ASPNG|nr:hypothetical protein ANI_1_606044 [Aspergillus niger CBS 513.88]KAI2814150.1 hypothetical protein CBS115989_8774 [Aspergillus niger]KAI2843287.1 hypothetical protein CBS11232_8292 [Aspergillus niger]KAI2871310.1 hypothetical protein CBS115988_8700 [Aspergillus niger]RDH14713.1 DUF1446-domain-containing protein [Aspergillus niger ATCC 13496]|eukprot:XP_001390820.2 hypothetical protein ANI_1_606044 [Aspergillus niger CBS 513.88]